MRVFLRNRTVWLQWYDSATQESRRASLGLTFDDPPDTSQPNWWKRTKHAQAIRDAITIREARVVAAELGVPYRQPPAAMSLTELLTRYNAWNRERRGQKSAKTLTHRESAVKWFRKRVPNATSRDLTAKTFLRLRGECEGEYSPASIRGYFRELASLASYGYRHGLCPEEYPARGIHIELTQKEPIPTPKDVEREFFTHLYHERRPLFDQLWFLRLTGARAGVSCALKWESVDMARRTWHHANTKARRSATLPMQASLLALFSHMPRKGEYVFAYRNNGTLHHYAAKVCADLGIQRINPHQLKRNYLYDLDGLDISDRLLTLAAHHAPHGETTVVARHYSRNRAQLLVALDAAQVSELAFFDALISGTNQVQTPQPVPKSADSK